MAQNSCKDAEISLCMCLLLFIACGLGARQCGDIEIAIINYKFCYKSMTANGSIHTLCVNGDHQVSFETLRKNRNIDIIFFESVSNMQTAKMCKSHALQMCGYELFIQFNIPSRAFNSMRVSAIDRIEFNVTYISIDRLNLLSQQTQKRT